MVSFGTEAFQNKTEKLIAAVKKEEGKFFLAHIYIGEDMFTVFGMNYFTYVVPGEFGQSEEADTAESVYKLIINKLWGPEAQRYMCYVPLPKAGELKLGNSKRPKRCHLEATGMMVASWDRDGLPCAIYPFDVQERYLKMALQYLPFAGQKDVRPMYNPLCLWAKDDFGKEAMCFIMPMRPEDGVSE